MSKNQKRFKEDSHLEAFSEFLSGLGELSKRTGITIFCTGGVDYHEPDSLTDLKYDGDLEDEFIEYYFNDDEYGEIEEGSTKTPIKEATSLDYKNLGQIVKGMVKPGSSPVSDALWQLIDGLGGVQERQVVSFLRGEGNLESISEEDVMEIEDLIEEGWQRGRKARGLRPTGTNQGSAWTD